jgi:4-amino-4-deoxy-L-arabinose transferase-like glycosyltransferase
MAPAGPSPGPRILLAIFAIALAARLGTIAWFGFTTLSFGDARDYIEIAETLAQTGAYPERTGFYFVRAPGYPLFLAVATLGHPRVVWLAKSWNAVLGAAACVLLAVLSARIFRRQTLAVATGVAAALHPSFLRISSDVQSEPLFLLLLLLFGYFLLAAADRPSGGLAGIAGAMLGFAALTRPTGLVLALLLLAPMWDRRWPARIRAQISMAAFAGLFAVVLPWTIRNAVVYRELIPINDAFGNAFYTGNSDWTVRYYALSTGAEIDAWTRDFDRDVRDRIARLDAAGVTSPGARSKAFLRAALEERRGDLAGWARLLARKALDWLRPWPNPGYWPAAIVWAVAAWSLVLYAAALWGLWSSERRGVAAFAVATLLLSMAFHVLVLVVWRYRVPYWDPILLLYGMAGALGARRSPSFARG